MQRLSKIIIFIFFAITFVAGGACVAKAQNPSFGNLGDLPAAPAFEPGGGGGGAAVGDADDAPPTFTPPNISDTSVPNIYTDPAGNNVASASSPQSAASAKTPTTAKIVPQVTCGVANIGEGTNFILGCLGQIIHYIWFSLMAWLMGVMGLFLNMTVQEFIVSFGSQTTLLAAITEGWVVLRDLANMVIIFFLLATGIGTILRLSDWGWKQLLARVIIAAIVINFSLFITKVIIDTSNLFTAQIYAGILQNAYGGGNGQSGVGAAGNAFQVNCAQTRQARKAEAAANDPDAAARGLLEDPCLKNGLSGAFTNVLNMTTLMTVPKDTKGVNNVGTEQKPDLQFGIDTMHFLIVAVLGGVMFFILAIVFGGMAIMLLTRWVALIMLMISSPIWMIGLIFGKGGKKYWDRLLENAIFPPVFFVMLYVAYVIAKGSMAVVKVNGAETNEIASYTLLATGGGGWDLLLHFALVIMMIVFAMRWAVETGDETAKLGGGLALGAMAGGGYLAWKGAKAGARPIGGWLAVKADNALARSGFYNNKGRVFGALGRWANVGMSKLTKSKLEARERDMKRRDLAEERTRLARTPDAREIAQLTPGRVKQRLLTNGRKPTLDWLNKNAHLLSPSQIEGMRKSAGLTTDEGNALVDAHFRGGVDAQGNLKPRLFDHFDKVRKAEAALTRAKGTPEEAQAQANLTAAREEAKSAVQKLNIAQISMLGERGVRDIMADPAVKQVFAGGLTKSHVEHISKDSAFGEGIEEEIKVVRYQAVTDTFQKFMDTTEGTTEYQTARAAFNEAYANIHTDEHAHGNIIGALTAGGQKAVERFVAALDEREFNRIQDSKEWDEKWKNAFIQAKIKPVTDTLAAIEQGVQVKDKKGNIVDPREMLRTQMKDFKKNQFKYLHDKITQGTDKQKDAFAFAMKPSHLNEIREADYGLENIEDLKSRRTRQAEELSENNPAEFQEWARRLGNDIAEEDPAIFDSPDAVKLLSFENIQKIGESGGSKYASVKKQIVDHYAKIENPTDTEATVMDILAGEFTHTNYGTSPALMQTFQERIKQSKAQKSGRGTTASVSAQDDDKDTMPVGFGREEEGDNTMP